MTTKQEVFQKHLERYLKATRQEKGDILDHVCFVTGMHCKSVGRAFRRLQLHGTTPTHKRRGRTVVYGPDVTVALKTVWETGSEVCGELLHAVTNEYIDILQRDGMWEHSHPATAKLRVMSEGTMKNRIGTFMKARRLQHGISSTKPSHLKQIVPIFTGPWSDKPPGHGQLDSVRHSDSAFGDAVYTVQYTDARTLVTVPRAQFNKGQQATKESMQGIHVRLVFAWLNAHPDSGSEFLNWVVKGWCDEEGIVLTRSRPNHKNDNMYVEERNGHVIRKFVGYIRLDCPEVVPVLNELYDVLTPYLLHFVAVRRMTGKVKIKSKYQRQYEKVAKTPYQRILEHPAVTNDVKTKLKAKHATLNPLVLKKEIERLQQKVYATQQRYGNHSRGS
jgi:hypothetical protein